MCVRFRHTRSNNKFVMSGRMVRLFTCGMRNRIASAMDTNAQIIHKQKQYIFVKTFSQFVISSLLWIALLPTLLYNPTIPRWFPKNTHVRKMLLSFSWMAEHAVRIHCTGNSHSEFPAECRTFHFAFMFTTVKHTYEYDYFCLGNF